MGLLSLGTPLHWNDAQKHADYVREHGIIQFLNIYDKVKGRKRDGLLWGDEVEYMVISYDDENRNARLSLRVFEMLNVLEKDEIEAAGDPVKTAALISLWRPEYGRFMLESTPAHPYKGSPPDLLQVEANMRRRRQIARSVMRPNESPLTITSFPRLGAPGVFLDPHHPADGPASRSLFLPDQVINPHARFPTLTANIRRRRGSKVAINMPIYHDTNTPSPFIDPTIPRDRGLYPQDKEAATGAALPDHIYMDSMGFGMGCSCLQITFQASDILESRILYDQLAPLAPIMLALTASAPIYRGYLADVDCRWDVIAGSVDDRTPEERGLAPLVHNKYRINKSRYDSIDCFISTDSRFRPEYNDLDLVYDKDICAKLMDHGIDEQLSRHIAHLFIRDPLVIFEELLHIDDKTSTDHFENLQSTNWQTIRFKPPPPDSPIGWRVEFRSMEVQVTDFENAAFAVFIVLLTRTILSYGINFYIPISKIDENMGRAHHRGAVLNEKFHFRKDVVSPANSEEKTPVEDEYTLMSVDEIINGKGTEFPGLIPLIEAYLDSLNVDIETRCALSRYLQFVKRRADGSLMTTATWIRKFVHEHPDYKHDSVVNESVNYDLIRALENIEKGELKVPELLGRFV